MVALSTQIQDYLRYCENQKNLDSHTLKAYRIDLRQFDEFLLLRLYFKLAPKVQAKVGKTENRFAKSVFLIFTRFRVD